MLLNCDLGESYGRWTMGMDAAVMPYIHQANIACGFHAGDPLTMRHTLALAAEHGVVIGAHPAYPDLVGFGRRSMTLSREEIIANLHYQIAALDGMAHSLGLSLAYIKPHGALYHDMMARSEVRAAIIEALVNYHRPLALMLQATVRANEHRAEAAAAGVPLLFEAAMEGAVDATVAETEYLWWSSTARRKRPASPSCAVSSAAMSMSTSALSWSSRVTAMRYAAVSPGRTWPVCCVAMTR